MLNGMDRFDEPDIESNLNPAHTTPNHIIELDHLDGILCADISVDGKSLITREIYEKSPPTDVDYLISKT